MRGAQIPRHLGGQTDRGAQFISAFQSVSFLAFGEKMQRRREALVPTFARFSSSG